MSYQPYDRSPSGIIFFGTNSTDQTFESVSTLVYDSGNNRLGINNAVPGGSLHVDNLQLNGNTLSATNTNGNLILTPNGNGAIQADSGGNARGTKAVDLQRVRTNANQIASGSCSFIGNGRNNTASASYSTIVNGGANCVTAWYGFIGGGDFNCVIGSGLYGLGSSIVGGNGNYISSSSDFSFIGGGSCNCSCNSMVTIGGGQFNSVSGYGSTIAGGQSNCSNNCYSTIGGGYSNCAIGDGSTVSGGRSNSASGPRSTVGGGLGNCASVGCATIGGGYYNEATGTYSTVSGGGSIQSAWNSQYRNTASAYASTIGGGNGNKASANASTISGGILNTASGINSTVSGGNSNCASGFNSSVSGGCCNITNARHSTINGGNGNVIQSPTNECCSRGATIGGGTGHNSSGGTVSLTTGDLFGTITCFNAGRFSTIGGGLRNCATGDSSTVGGGAYNLASGDYSSVVGYCNSACHTNSHIIGSGITSSAADTLYTNKICANNTITGTSIIKSGGTSSEFLKADGSVDSTGYTTCVGTVTSVAAGSGMNFGTITTTGSVVLGTPSDVTLSSTNSVTANSHTHDFAPGGDTTEYIRGDGSLATFPTNVASGVGSSGHIAFWTATNSLSYDNNELFWDQANNRLGIGTNGPSYELDVTGSGNFTGDVYTSGNIGIGTNSLSHNFVINKTGKEPDSAMKSSSGSSASMFNEGASLPGLLIGMSSSTGYTHRGSVYMNRSRGTLDSPEAVQDGDWLGSYYGAGYDGSALRRMGGVIFVVDGTVSSGNVPTSIMFQTGSSSRTEKMRITHDGKLGIGTSSPAYMLDVDGSGRFTGTLNVNGDLIVNGTTTTVNSTVVEIQDPIIILGSGTPTTDDNKDRGIAFNYFDGSAKQGFFGYDDTEQKFTFMTDATIAGEVVSGTVGTIKANLVGDVTGNADTATLATDASGLTSAVTVGLSGQLSGSNTFQDAGDTLTIDASLTSEAITDQAEITSVDGTNDHILIYDSGVGLRKVTPQNFIDDLNIVTSFNVSDGTTNVTVEQGETLSFADGTGAEFVVTNNAGQPTITVNSVDTEIVHDNLSGVAPNEHIDHSTVSILGGSGLLNTGGDITSSRTLHVGAGNGITVAADSVALASTVAGSGLNYANGVLNIGAGSGIGINSTTIGLTPTNVTAASYGSASSVGTFTVDANGRLTAAATTAISITASQVSDFDTAAESAIFTDANFEDSTRINFTVTAGQKVTADLIANTISETYLTASVAGDGLAGGNGTALSVNVDDSTIEIDSDTLRVKDGGITEAKLSRTVDATFSNNDVIDADINLVNGGAGGITIKLPAPAIGKMVYVKKIDSAVGAVTVERNGTSDSIDGATQKILYSQYESLSFVSDGTHWYIV